MADRFSWADQVPALAARLGWPEGRVKTVLTLYQPPPGRRPMRWLWFQERHIRWRAGASQDELVLWLDLVGAKHEQKG